MTQNYINNEKLYEEMLKYHIACQESKEKGTLSPRISNYIGECIMLVAENLAKRPNFCNYSFIDEMKSDAIENCVKYIYNYNPYAYKNPFGYFTKIAWQAFVRRIQSEERQLYIKIKNMENSFIFDELYAEGAYSDGHQVSLTDLDYDKTNQFVLDYEERLTKKREASKMKLEQRNMEEPDE